MTFLEQCLPKMFELQDLLSTNGPRYLTWSQWLMFSTQIVCRRGQVLGQADGRGDGRLQGDLHDVRQGRGRHGVHQGAGRRHEVPGQQPHGGGARGHD